MRGSLLGALLALPVLAASAAAGDDYDASGFKFHAGAGGGSGSVAGTPLNKENYGAHPPSEDADKFYKQEIDAAGLKVRSSERVEKKALRNAADIVLMMLKRGDVRAQMEAHAVRVLVFARKPLEKLTDLPEMSKDKDGRTDDGRAFNDLRGIASGPPPPNFAAMGEETLPESSYYDPVNNSYFGGIWVPHHEFAHTILRQGLDAKKHAEVEAAYQKAKEEGLWKGSRGEEGLYVMTNVDEYFACTTQTYFRLHQALVDVDPRMEKVLRSIYEP